MLLISRALIFRSLCLVLLSGFIARAGAVPVFSTGFEPTLYSTGTVNGQDGWVVSKDPDNSSILFANANVSTTNPDTGLQQLRLTGISDLAGTLTGARTAQFVVPNGSTVETSFRLSIGGVTPGVDAGANYYFDLPDRANGGIAARLVFAFTGDILVDDGGAQLIDTLSDWTSNGYHTYSITVNSAANSIVYTRDGSTLATTALIPPGVGGGTTVDQLQFLSDNFQISGEFADLDNLSLSTVVPEPVGLAILGLGAMLSMSRRRAV